MKLTPKQEAFALAYIMNGRVASKAYVEVYDVGEDTLPTTIWRNAHAVLKNAKVTARVNELQMQKYNGDIMSIEERKLLLTSLTREGDIKSLDMLNKMEGVYIEKHEIEIGGKITYTANFPKKRLKPSK